MQPIILERAELPLYSFESDSDSSAFLTEADAWYDAWLAGDDSIERYQLTRNAQLLKYPFSTEALNADYGTALAGQPIQEGSNARFTEDPVRNIALLDPLLDGIVLTRSVQLGRTEPVIYWSGLVAPPIQRVEVLRSMPKATMFQSALSKIDYMYTALPGFLDIHADRVDSWREALQTPTEQRYEAILRDFDETPELVNLWQELLRQDDTPQEFIEERVESANLGWPKASTKSKLR
jgi:hypothetical protein